ncbi:glycerophosphoryl diester esterase [Legionella birminghamensis]|uniref:Glycerophosphoryl diester esterase n=1 Tax=Legionella birminghamensis TaxID=28083 RepID=A0A378I7N3_9GAMM|nr:glycerophosphoryl diester phosphodiesterase [Legionella birminghamensis]KTC68063.1 glycerophosphoryl diester esterase [Legionella birminghamensis]STX31227.1 glycerophosphoryl diester phosphodiesterase [Legionella birminghamensis]
MPLQIHNHVIGHRGAAGYAPENTQASFDKALALGCTAVEFDIMLTADGEPYVFHDENLKRTTNGQGELGLVNADYVKNLDAGSWFSKQYKSEKVLHFRDLIKWLVFSNVTANVEIKPYPGTAEQTAITVLSYINRFWPQSREMPLVSSFDYNVLSLCRSLSPELPLGLLLDRWEKDWLKKAKELQCFSIHINRRALTAERVKEIKDQGYQLYVYTVNWKRQAKKLIEWGVDAVFSDYPDLLS